MYDVQRGSVSFRHVRPVTSLARYLRWSLNSHGYQLNRDFDPRQLIAGVLLRPHTINSRQVLWSTGVYSHLRNSERLMKRASLARKLSKAMKNLSGSQHMQ
jgi:hypothetical protein